MERPLLFRHYLFILFLLIGVLLPGFLLQQKVQAQSETVLAILPALTNLYFNGELSKKVQVQISDVEFLNGFDITLTYDENITSVISWSHGGFLSNLNCFREINDPGYFRLACAQIAQPGVSGSGTLINLTFTGITDGVTSVIIDEDTLELSDSSSQPITAAIQNATITVGYAASAVVGNFLLQSQSNRAGIPVSLSPGLTYSQGPYDVLSIHDLCQNLVFPSVVNNDSYTLTTNQPRYLNLSKSVTVPVGTDLALPPLRLLAGDAVADNAINTADLDAIRDAFGTLGEGISADVNFDGVVDLRDLALAAGNYGLTPTEAYSGWVP